MFHRPLLLACVLASLGWSVTHGSVAHAELATADGFTGEGSARIVGGNLVSARRRALAQAQQVALAAAVTSLKLTLDAAALRALVARVDRLLRNYSVQEERRDGQTYRLRLSASFDLARLRRIASPRAASPRPTRVAVAPTLIALQLQVVGTNVVVARNALLKELGASLTGRGMTLATGASDRSAAQIAAPGARGLLVVKLETAEAPGVRGLALLGGQAKLGLRVEQASGGLLAQRSAAAWGRGQSVAEAIQQAVQRVVAKGLDASLLAGLEARWRALPRKAGDLVLRIGGLQAPEQYRQVRRVLLQRGLTLRLRRLHGDHVTWLIGAAGDAAKLASLLTSQVFQGFSLVTQPGGAPLELQVRPLAAVGAATSAPTAP